ncbi:MAG: HPr family phosphocarrier protein [Tissierellaceae bacterium]|nr:HPr family phosphocarrier protein [Tissierellaceae bacterium]
MAEREVILSNDTGLHARPASMVVREANKYESEIKFIKEDKEYNGKSIMSILSMGAIKGDAILIRALGKDEENAVVELKEFIEKKIVD